MITLVSSNAEIVCPLRGRVAVRVSGEQLLQNVLRFPILVAIEKRLADTQHERGNQLFWPEKSHGAIVLFAIFVEQHQSGCPLNFVPLRKGLRVDWHPHWHEMLFEKIDDLRIWIRNCIHLLAANSKRIKEVPQDIFVLSLGFC